MLWVMLFNIQGAFDAICLLKHYYTPNDGSRLNWSTSTAAPPVVFVGEWRCTRESAPERQFCDLALRIVLDIPCGIPSTHPGRKKGKALPVSAHRYRTEIS